MHLDASVFPENAMMKISAPIQMQLYTKSMKSVRKANKEGPSRKFSAGWEENGEGSMDHDVLAVSMMKLHSAQEAIQREVQKLKDVGKEFLSNSIQPSNLEATMFQSSIIETQTTLNQDVVQGDLKSEPDEILKQRIQVQVQYIVISSQIIQQSGYVQLMVQQKKLALQHMEVMNKVECAESKAGDLNREADKLKVTCHEILEKEQVLKIQNRVCRLTCCFTVQLILFVLVVYLQFSNPSHHRNLVLVPT